MDKSYKCSFCKFDTGPAMEPKENCTDCKFGCNFELVDKMHPTPAHEWRKHQELDKLFEDSNLALLDYQRDLAHRLLVASPSYFLYSPRATRHDFSRLRQLFMEVLCAKSQTEKEKEGESKDVR